MGFKLFDIVVKGEAKDAVCRIGFGAPAEATLVATQRNGFVQATKQLHRADIHPATVRRWQDIAWRNSEGVPLWERKRLLNRAGWDRDKAEFDRLCGIVQGGLIDVLVGAGARRVWEARAAVRAYSGVSDAALVSLVARVEEAEEEFEALHRTYLAQFTGVNGDEVEFLDPATKCYRTAGRMHGPALALFAAQAVRLGHKLGLIWQRPRSQK
jgi:hypothetical protein